MIRPSGWLSMILALGTVMELAAQSTISWSSTTNAVNQTSSGSLMDSGFRFELGVFTGSFVPTNLNMSSWAANWNPVQRTSYDASNNKFASSFNASSNAVPFTAGKAAYVWGFRGDATSGEWILFRTGSWSWPDVNAFPPSNPTWPASAATPVLGSINANGNPFLMKTAAVANAAPPATSFAQWQADYLTGEPLNGPNDDPDKDGMTNLLEFVMGTLPKSANAPVGTPVALVSGHLQITVPRRIDRTATLTVEVSSDLKNWNSGSGFTQILSNGLASLVVGDLTAIDSAHPKRFMRLRAAIP